MGKRLEKGRGRRVGGKKASQSVRGGGDAEVGSGDYRLSGVFYL